MFEQVHTYKTVIDVIKFQKVFVYAYHRSKKRKKPYFRLMTNAEIAGHFNLLAQLMELHDENTFKIRSYQFAYRTLKNFGTPLTEMSEAGIKNIQGIGDAISKKIIDLIQTGKLDLLEKYLAITPPGVVEMLAIKGIGPKKIQQLWKELDIETLGELYYACIENRITLLKGFGEKTQESLIQSIEFMLQNARKFLWARLEPAAEKMMEVFKTNFSGDEWQFVGEYNRKAAVVESLDFITTSHKTSVTSLLNEGAFKTESQTEYLTFSSPTGLNGKIYFTTTEQMGHLAFTLNCSEAFYKTFSERYKIEASANEQQIFASAHFPYLAPEIRDSPLAIKLAADNKLNELVTEADILGVVHTHTKWSDGGNTIEEMAAYAKTLGYQYLVITDHSKSAFYANGLSEARIQQQHEEIDRINDKMTSFKIFKGIEADILNDGQLDYGDDILKTFDCVIASVHSNLKMNGEKSMQRLMKAIENPYTHILGHMTGRLLLSRKGYPVDHKTIIDACAQNGVSIELNANPHRLDIDAAWLEYCMEKGVLISINPDAHNLRGMHDIRYGVMQARKGLLIKAFLLNGKDADEFGKWLKK